MTTHPTEPPAMSPTPRRTPWPWLIAGVAVIVAAVVVTLVLASGDDGGDQNTAATSTPTGSGGPDTDYDLSTPETAAESFARAATTGSGDTLLSLSCVGRPSCVGEHAAEVAEPQLAEARDTLREGVFELAEHLKGAEFTTAIDGPEPGTKNVPYRTPEMTGDAYLALTFVQSGDEWLYYRAMT